VLVKYEYSRTSLSRMAKIQGICPGQRIIRDSELGFGVKKFRIQGISSGTAGDPGKRDPGQRGATVQHPNISGKSRDISGISHLSPTWHLPPPVLGYFLPRTSIPIRQGCARWAGRSTGG